MSLVEAALLDQAERLRTTSPLELVRRDKHRTRPEPRRCVGGCGAARPAGASEKCRDCYLRESSRP